MNGNNFKSIPFFRDVLSQYFSKQSTHRTVRLNCNSADAWGAGLEHTHTPNPAKKRVQTSRSLQLLIPKGEQALLSQHEHELQYTVGFNNLQGFYSPLY